MKNKSFDIPAHLENKLSPTQCAEDIAQHFSSISQLYHPVDLSKLSPNLQTFLLSTQHNLPYLSDYDVFTKLRKSKKVHSYVKGEVHPKLMHCFNVEFSQPVARIFNSIISTQKYPDQWKVEHGVPIPKSTSSPESLDELRIISKTNKKSFNPS